MDNDFKSIEELKLLNKLRKKDCLPAMFEIIFLAI